MPRQGHFSRPLPLVPLSQPLFLFMNINSLFLQRTKASCSCWRAFGQAFWSLPELAPITEAGLDVTSLFISCLLTCVSNSSTKWTKVFLVSWVTCSLCATTCLFVLHMELSFLAHLYIWISSFLLHLTHLLFSACLKGLSGYFPKRRSQSGNHYCAKSHWIHYRNRIQNFCRRINLIQWKMPLTWTIN